MTEKEQLVKDALNTFKESSETYYTKVSVLAIIALLVDKGIATSDEIDKYIDTWTEQMDEMIKEKFANEDVKELRLASMFSKYAK